MLFCNRFLLYNRWYELFYINISSTQQEWLGEYFCFFFSWNTKYFNRAFNTGTQLWSRWSFRTILNLVGFIWFKIFFFFLHVWTFFWLSEYILCFDGWINTIWVHPNFVCLFLSSIISFGHPMKSEKNIMRNNSSLKDMQGNPC